MTWAYLIVGWLLLSILVAAAVAAIFLGRARFNPELAARQAGHVCAPTSPAAQDRALISVLVADDDIRLGTIILSLLQADPRFHDAHWAADGAATLALTRRARPDVVLLDVQMPIMTGLELLPQLRAMSPPPAVVLFTADTAPDVLRAAAQYDVHYLVKSTPIDAVLDEVAAVGATRHSLGGNGN